MTEPVSNEHILLQSGEKSDVTSLPKGAVRYACPCGAEYLVALDAADNDEAWLEMVRDVADSLDVGFVDGSHASFVCDQCGRTHVRGE
jgi:hypothetical protein